MNLSFLSIVRLRPRTVIPSVPTNEDRLRAFRAAMTPTVGNAYQWPHKGRVS